MYQYLNPLLDRLGLRAKPRYTLEEVAEMIGIRRDQVLDLLKRGKLLGMRASERRWSGILAEDLDDYLEEMQALSMACRRRSTPAVAVVLTMPVPVPSPMSHPKLPVTLVPPSITPIPCNHDPTGALAIEETPTHAHAPKPSLNF